jgi:hypothetical protein
MAALLGLKISSLTVFRYWTGATNRAERIAIRDCFPDCLAGAHFIIALATSGPIYSFGVYVGRATIGKDCYSLALRLAGLTPGVCQGDNIR